MSRRTDIIGAAAGGGPFYRLAEFVVRWPLVVIGCWVVLAVVLPLTFPSLTEMVEKRPVAVLPADATAMVATQQMTEAFHESGSDNILMVVLSNDNGLRPADETTYRTLADDLRRDLRDVTMVQDFLSTPTLRELWVSQDGKAWILSVGLAGELGTPQSHAAYTRVADIVENTVAGSALTAHLSGPAATIADLTDAGERDRLRIEIALAIMLLTILLVIYRNPVTMLLPLMTIGVSLVIAQAVVAGLGELGLGVSNQTIVFLTAIMAGAGTDYAVFLISRYHDHVRHGIDSDLAIARALASIGKVIAASAATVAVTLLAMTFARLGPFSAAGIPLAVGVGVAFFAAVTLLPAILALAGPRGWVRPRRDRTARFWRRAGIHVVRRPWAHLVAGTLVLGLLAGCAMMVRFNYDDRTTLPRTAESNVGYAALDRHFPLNSTIPQYLFIQSPHDLRTPHALAALEQMAQRVTQLPGIEMVRGITRPSGRPLEAARLSYQAGEIGDELDTTSTQITNNTGELDRLARGANTLADNLQDVRGQVTQAVATVRGLVDVLTFMQSQFGGDQTLGQIDDVARLVNNMRALGDGLGVNFADLESAFDWAGPVVAALDASPVCDADPSCRSTRGEFRRLVTARSDGTFDRIADLARQLQSTQGAQTLESTANALRSALATATSALRSSGLSDAGGMRARLTNLQQGADDLADAGRRLADGVQRLVDQTKRMGVGLGETSAFLLAMKYDAATPPMAGFYIPPRVMTQDEFKKAAEAFISPDGHAARYVVQTKLNPFSTEGMDQVNAVTETAREAQPNTALADASTSVVGYPATLRDTRDYYNHDIRFIIVVTIVVVLLILIALLRAVVAPLYLVGSVVVSYLSALGLGVVMFQFILGQELHWSVPGLAFIILVAVGADYNMLLVSRMRDESPDGVRSGIIRTVGSTGGVITAAGLIFAGSMFGLLFASITSVVQAGFVVGVGILLDTFLVRTIVVPATAVLVGNANWWPSRWRPHSPAGRTERR